jgi:hypothetical protein
LEAFSGRPIQCLLLMILAGKDRTHRPAGPERGLCPARLQQFWFDPYPDIPWRKRVPRPQEKRPLVNQFYPNMGLDAL